MYDFFVRSRVGAMAVATAMFLLSFTSFWFAVSCQDVERLTSRLPREEKIGKAMTNLQMYDKEDLKDVLSAIENIQDLWTVYLTEVLEESNSRSSNLSEECHKSAMNLLEYQSLSNISVPGSRLIPIIDATGKQGAGLLTGNVILDGAYDECFSYNYTGFCVASSVSLSPEATNISITWKVGMCVPKGCNSNDISLLINETKILQADPAAITCLDSKFPGYDAGAIIMLIITGVFILLTIMGTVLDTALMHARNTNKKESSADDDRIAVSNMETDKGLYLEKANLLATRRDRCENKVKTLEFITAFSLFKTLPALLATKQAPSVITSLNGLRVISMFCIILGHVHFWIFKAGAVNVIDTDNTPISRDVMSRFTYRFVEVSFFAVDTFFFISGVLVAYLTLREMKKRKNRFPFIYFYAHRYLRLTPTYAFVLFLAWFVTPHLAYGPGIMTNPFSKTCRLYWWTNLLYINNLYPWRLDDVCLNWTWYLSNDMQFYIISPLILIAAYHLLPVGVIISGLFLASGCFITGALAGIYDFQANKFSIIAYGYAGKPGSPGSYFDAIYTKPWDRISPYIVGLALGYVLYRSYRFCYSRITNSILYGLALIIALFIGFWIIYGLYFTWHGHIPMAAENIIYITFSRFLWALCLALMVFTCHNGYGWFINSFLSMKIWTPLARMTFAVYLVHPVVLTVIYGQLQTPMHYTDITVACYTVALAVLSYGLAGIICVLVELPLGTVEMLVFKLIICKSQRQDARTKYEEIKKPKN